VSQTLCGALRRLTAVASALRRFTPTVVGPFRPPAEGAHNASEIVVPKEVSSAHSHDVGEKIRGFIPADVAVLNIEESRRQMQAAPASAAASPSEVWARSVSLEPDIRSLELRHYVE